MYGNFSRRAFLKSGLSAALVLSAGCLDRGDSGWAVYGCDERNSAYNRGSYGPRGEVSLLWRDRSQSGSGFEAGAPPGASGNPVVVEDTVIVSTATRGQVAFTLGGGVRWSLGEGFAVGSVAVDGDRVYAGETVRDLGSGEVVWSSDHSFGLANVYDGVVYGGYAGRHPEEEIDREPGVQAIDADSGELIWHAELGTSGRYPAVGEDSVYVAIEDVFCVDRGSGDREWTVSREDAGFSGHTLGDDYLIAESREDVVYAFDTSSGEGVWRFDLDGSLEGSVAVADGAIYLGSRGGEEPFYSLDESSGEVLWNTREGKSLRGAPAVADEVVYLADFDTLEARDVDDGELLWSYEHSHHFNHDLTVVEGRIYGSTVEENVAVFGGPG